MKIETKFDIGNDGFVLHNNEVCKVEVISIHTNSTMSTDANGIKKKA